MDGIINKWTPTGVILRYKSPSHGINLDHKAAILINIKRQNLKFKMIDKREFIFAYANDLLWNNALTKINKTVSTGNRFLVDLVAKEWHCKFKNKHIHNTQIRVYLNRLVFLKWWYHEKYTYLTIIDFLREIIYRAQIKHTVWGRNFNILKRWLQLENVFL